MVKNKNENEALYGGISPPPKGATPPNEGKELSPLTLCLAWRSCFIFYIYLVAMDTLFMLIFAVHSTLTMLAWMSCVFFYVYICCHRNMNECEPWSNSHNWCIMKVSHTVVMEAQYCLFITHVLYTNPICVCFTDLDNMSCV